MIRLNQYTGPAKNGSQLKGELYTSGDDKCKRHPKAVMLEFNIGPAWEFYCCSECEK